VASLQHQWLLLWVARKMTADGFLLTAYEGPTPQGGVWNNLPRPPTIEGVRPDAAALETGSGLAAVGEAKSYTDVDTFHTRAQLGVFGNLDCGNARRCRLYVAVPRSAANLLDRVLVDLGLIGARHLTRLHIPDVLLGAR